MSLCEVSAPGVGYREDLGGSINISNSIKKAVEALVARPGWVKDIKISKILLEELDHVLDEEYEKESAKAPKVEKKEPVTQAEKCAEGMHGRIVDGERGETCSACGTVMFYWFLNP